MSDGGGVVKVSGDVAGRMIDSLKSQPALLFLLVLNIFIFGMLGYIALQNSERRATREKMIIERCFPRPQQPRDEGAPQHEQQGAVDALRP
jgi:hypothetical protein